MVTHAPVVAMVVIHLVQQEKWLPEQSLDSLELVESATYVMERWDFVTQAEMRGSYWIVERVLGLAC